MPTTKLRKNIVGIEDKNNDGIDNYCRVWGWTVAGVMIGRKLHTFDGSRNILYDGAHTLPLKDRPLTCRYPRACWPVNGFTFASSDLADSTIEVARM